MKEKMILCLIFIFAIMTSGCLCELFSNDITVEADFAMNPSEGPAPLTVQFINKCSTTDGSFSSYAWTFDDGNGSDERDPVHTFYFPGEYNVTLHASVTGGKDDSKERTIIVYPSDHTPPDQDTVSTFNATADTYVDETNPDMNYGQRTYIMVNDDCEIYLKFTGLPAANTIEKAEVKLYNTFRMENGPEVEALTALSHWNENTVTWNNGMTFAIGSLDTTEANGTQQWFSWDVTTGVKNDMSGGLVIVILRAVTSGHAQFFTRENDNIYTPKLELTLSS